MMTRIVRFFLATVATSAGALVGHAQVQNAPDSVCEFVATYAGTSKPIAGTDLGVDGSLKFEDLLQNDVLADVDKDGDLEVLSRKMDNGTMRGFRLVWSGASDDLDVAHIYEQNPDLFEEYLRWGFDQRWLYYRDRWYGVNFTNESLKTAVGVFEFSPDGPIVSCGFKSDWNEVRELPTDDTEVPDICSSLVSHKDQREFLGHDPDAAALTENDIQYLLNDLQSNFHRRDDVLSNFDSSIDISHSLYEIDFNNDNEVERLVRIVVSSPAGRGCGGSYFELLASNGEDAPDLEKREALLEIQKERTEKHRYPFQCGSYREWLMSDGGNYIHTRQFSRHTVVPYRTLHRLSPEEGNELVCESRFEPVHTVAYDRGRDEPEIEINPNKRSPNK